MEVSETTLFHEFASGHLIGIGFASYEVQRKSILNMGEPVGHFQRIIKLSGRVAMIDYYLSEKLDTLFVLSGHIVRAGDKREKEQKAIREYISIIRSQEEE
jgi:hypothetical protein